MYLLPVFMSVMPLNFGSGGSQLNNMEHITFFSGESLTQYFGFNEDEVQDLLKSKVQENQGKIQNELKVMHELYDGYINLYTNKNVYNPYSAVQYIRSVQRNEVKKSKFYWHTTGYEKGVLRCL